MLSLLDNLADQIAAALEKGQSAAGAMAACYLRQPDMTCDLILQTCAPGVATQTKFVQGAAIRLIAELTGQDAEEVLDDFIDSICSVREGSCASDVREGLNVDTLNTRELAIETAYNVAYYTTVTGGAPVVAYRGVAVPQFHRLASRLRSCEAGGAKNCYGSIGTHYKPKPLESWSLDKEISRKFALASAAGRDFVPILISKTIHTTIGMSEEPESLYELAQDRPALPAISSFTSSGCLFTEKEIALLWTNHAPEPGSADAEIQIERVG